jgi:hypothetical protein
MITAYQAERRGDVIDCEPLPFNYPQEGPHARQRLFSAIVVVVLAAITVMVGVSLAGISS